MFDYHNVSSPNPLDGIDGRATMSCGGIDHGHQRSGSSLQPAPGGPWSESLVDKVTPATTRDDGMHRRPRPSNAFDPPVPLVRTPTEATSTTTSTSGTDDSEAHRDLWKVRVSGGVFLDSTSYSSSLHEDNVRSNATEMLMRLKLDKTDDGDGDKESSTATAKLSNQSFQMKIQKKTLNRSLSSYYRPVDSLAKTDAVDCYSAPTPLPLPLAMSVKSATSRSRSSKSVSDPSDMSVTIDTMPSAVSCLSYNSFEEEDTTQAHTTHNKMPMGRNPNFRKKNELRQLDLVKSASESDDDSELKRMESVTHTFQRKDVSDGASGKKKSKFSAVPLSGIGVDVRNDYNDEQRVHTPREAMNASCSISSFMGDIFGMTPPREGSTPINRSPFNIVRDLLCTPDRAHSATVSANKGNRRKPYAKPDDTESEYANDWSVDVDIRNDYASRRPHDEDGRSESCARSEVASRYTIDTNLDGSYSHRHRSVESNRNNTCRSGEKSRSRRSETRQERYDKNLTYRHYHREDLSYHGTEAGTSCYQSTSYSCDDDDRSETVRRSPVPPNRKVYRDSPVIARRLKSRKFEDRHGDDDNRL